MKRILVVSESGQVTLPVEMCELLGVARSGVIMVEDQEGQIILSGIRPVRFEDRYSEEEISEWVQADAFKDEKDLAMTREKLQNAIKTPGLKWSLYLDDLRLPHTDRQFMIARSYAEALELVIKFGCPTYVSFDHDLGDNVPSGFDFAKWLVEKDLNGEIDMDPLRFEYNVHSANPVGAENIRSLLAGFLEFKRRA